MAPPSALSSPSEAIKEPRDYDVLLGRGAGTRMHIGNQQFLDWVEQVKPAYHATQSLEIKKSHAVRVIDAVKKCKGRFLEKDKHTNVWHEISDDRVLAKTKQALREKSTVGTATKTHGEAQAQVVHNPIFRQLGPEAFSYLEAARNLPLAPVNPPSAGAPSGLTTGTAPFPFPGVGSFQARPEFGGVSRLYLPGGPSLFPPAPGVLSGEDFVPRNVLSEFGILAEPPSRVLTRMDQLPTCNVGAFTQSRDGLEPFQQVSMGALASFVPPLPTEIGSSLADCPFAVDGSATCAHRVSEAKPSYLLDEAETTAGADLERISSFEAELADNLNAITEPALESSSEDLTPFPPGASDEDRIAAEFLLSMLTEPRRVVDHDTPLSNEEQNAALSDLFGAKCCVAQPHKRLKRDDRIPSLLFEMRRELEFFSGIETQAWLEASRKARVSEVDDRRLELFLHRDDLDPKKAARRLVTYWEERRKWFGPDKFCLPMTLHGAVQDDHVAIETGLTRMLPGLDDSGRQMILVSMSKNTKEGYTMASMVRTCFYWQEVMCQRENAVHDGLVRLVWFGNDYSIWDTDWDLSLAAFDLQRKAFPVNLRATHICNPPFVMAKIVIPRFLVQINKSQRARVVIHDVSGEEIVKSLSEYGIPINSIPVELGGKLNYSFSQCLADRRDKEAEWEHIPDEKVSRKTKP